MTSDEFYDLFGNIDSDIVDFAENYKFKRRRNFKPLISFGALAAAVTLIFCLTPLRNLLSFAFGGASGTSVPEASINDSYAPETAAEKYYLIEATGNGSAKLTMNRAENVIVVGMTPTDDQLVYTIDTENSDWQVEILVVGIDDFSFDFTDPSTGNALEIASETHEIDRSEVEKYKSGTP